MAGKKIVIIGGGIAGLYAAWRLRELQSGFEVEVYEAAGRIGGRIDTATFGIFDKKSGAEPTELKAELGAMRFPREHRMLFDLCEKLGIPNVDKTSKPDAWRGPFELKSLYHLRGTTLSKESLRRGKIPYRVRPEEKGKTPEALLEYAIFVMLAKMIDDETKKGGGYPDDCKLKFLKEFRQSLKDHEVLSADQWVTFIKNDYEFAGIPLRNIGFWNVLKHFLSSEAFLLAHDGFGFLSVISNWNAPEAFKWLLTDFSPHQRFQTIPDGVIQIVEKLEQRLEGVIQKNHTLRDVHREGKRFQLRFEGKEDEDVWVWADHVVLAIPPNALGRIRLFDGVNQVKPKVERDWKQLIHCSRPHRLAKIVLAYEDPWWQHTRIPGAESGRLFTDLPMRQIHYFGPKWLAENRWGDKATSHSLVMVYNDSHYEAFWRAFHVHDKVYRDVEVIERTLGRRPESIVDGADHFWGPDKMEKLKRLLKSEPKPDEAELRAELRKIDEATEVDDKYEVRHRMEEKVRAQLSELHEYDVPMAIGGVYRDWSDEGGWHTWEPFVDVPKVKDVILQPFCEGNDGFGVRPLGTRVEDSHPLPFYICGEAYAWEQGWIEGALMTAERVAAVITGSGDSCEVPKWFSKGKQAVFDKYMYAELSVKKQNELDEADRAKKKA